MPAATLAQLPFKTLRPGRRLQRPFVLALLAVVALLILATRQQIASVSLEHLGDVLILMALIIVTDALAVEVGGLRLTLDFPLLLAVAILHSPALALVVGLLASMDWREAWHSGDAAWNALFNRGQIALSVFLAGSTLHWIAPDLESLFLAVLGTLGALIVDYAANTGLVALHLSLRDGHSTKQTLSQLWVGAPATILAVYVGYGCLGLLLAYLGRDVGLWSIVAFLIPTVAAQRLLVATLRLRDLGREMEVMRRHVENLIDQVGEERRDERRRILGGLHDDVLQSLLRIGLLGKILQRRLPRELGADPDVRDLVSESSACTSQLRDVINDLRRSPIGRSGVAESIRGLVGELRRVSRVEILLDVSDDVAISDDAQVVAYQVAREALNNSLRHSGARTIRVKLRQQASSAVLEVADDGEGFAPDSVDSDAHFGLELCRERVGRADGELTISTSKDGTSLRAAFPFIQQPSDSSHHVP